MTHNIFSEQLWIKFDIAPSVGHIGLPLGTLADLNRQYRLDEFDSLQYCHDGSEAGFQIVRSYWSNDRGTILKTTMSGLMTISVSLQATQVIVNLSLWWSISGLSQLMTIKLSSLIISKQQFGLKRILKPVSVSKILMQPMLILVAIVYFLRLCDDQSEASF